MLIIVFPGQGSQAVGMLAELAARHASVRETFAEASSGADVDLWTLSQVGPESKLNQTEFTQPALIAADVAVWRVWNACGGASPHALAGHSLGEYAALVAAEVLDLADAARLVRTRGRLMQDAVPAGTGAMAAILGGDSATIASICASVDGVVVPANDNAPGQIVIGGETAAVEQALVALAEAGIRKAIRLPVSVPSHTPLMREASEQLREAIYACTFRTPTMPVWQNVGARVETDIAAIREALVAQLHQPVRWRETMEALAATGDARFGESGPGKVLSGLIKRIDRTADARALGMPDDLDAARAAWQSPNMEVNHD
ncbi:MAG: ACP S-malonyltransferase [Lysobacterales bacterium]